MKHQVDYVSDWFMPSSDLRADALVAVAHKSKDVGVYRVKDVGCGTMTLFHGGVSFAVGTQLVVHDFQQLVPNTSKPFSATVVANNHQDIQIAW
ncbi:MAG: hypothetical protein WBX11_13075 [Thiobacillaceae bacterium]|jgi:hypothetical protein